MTKEQYISKNYMNEDQFQAATFMYLNNNYPELRGLLFHVPNEGAKSKFEGAKLKSMGVVAGVPDLILVSPMCGIELKMPNGRLSPSQNELHKTWLSAGVPCYVCWNAIEVVELFQTKLKNK